MCKRLTEPLSHTVPHMITSYSQPVGAEHTDVHTHSESNANGVRTSHSYQWWIMGDVVWVPNGGEHELVYKKEVVQDNGDVSHSGLSLVFTRGIHSFIRVLSLL